MASHPVQLFAGKSQPFAGIGNSSIRKQPLTEAVFLGEEGFDADEQTERKYHGGKERALLHFPREHYMPTLAYWHNQERFRYQGTGDSSMTWCSTSSMLQIEVFSRRKKTGSPQIRFLYRLAL